MMKQVVLLGSQASLDASLQDALGFLTFALVLAMRIFSVPPLHLLDFIPDSILASGEGSPQRCST